MVCLPCRGLVSVAVLLAASWIAVGCVPYQTYEQVKDELARAKDVNAELIRKYNVAQQKSAAVEGNADEVAAVRAAYEKRIGELEAQLGSGGPAFRPEDIARVPGAQPAVGGGLSLGESLLFSEGSAKLRPEANQTLDRMLALLKEEYATTPFIIEGHTDNQPLVKTRALYGNNMTLGYERARAVFEYCLGHGIPESRMVVESFSYNQPIDPATKDTEDGRRQNRRVVIRLGRDLAKI